VLFQLKHLSDAAISSKEHNQRLHIGHPFDYELTI